MTVSYYPHIATVRQGALIGLLLRWRGSLYKLVLPELVLFLIMYTAVSLIYRFALTETQRAFFVNLCVYLDRYTNQSGLTFCLGFFVSIVMARWWETFKTMPWLNTPAYVFRQMIVGGTETDCFDVRRRLVRYLMLSWVFLMRKVSGQIMRRFKPSSKLLRDATLEQKLTILNEDLFIGRYYDAMITDKEIETVIRFAKQVYPDSYDNYNPDHFLPLGWAADLVRDARKRNLIQTDFQEQHVLKTLERFRSQLAMIGLMDQFNIPLVYTQVVCWSMHVYFIFSLFAEQFHGNAVTASSAHGDSNGSDTGTRPPIDLYVPFPSLFQLAFYFGWIKVAEVCLNPFGDDDDDFPMWNVLNMNVESSFKIITSPVLAPAEHPPTPSHHAASPTSSTNQNVQLSRRHSQTSQFEAFADTDAAERFRDEYGKLARKYERPAFRGSAIESQMDREGSASSSSLAPGSSEYPLGGSRLVLHEAASRALRKVSNVLRGTQSSAAAARPNGPEEGNLLAPSHSIRVQRASWGWNTAEVAETTCAEGHCESPGAHSNSRMLLQPEDAQEPSEHGSVDNEHAAKWTHHDDGHLEVISEEVGPSSIDSCSSASRSNAELEDRPDSLQLRKVASPSKDSLSNPAN